MDAKLKALKVVDLRNILATARVPVPAKATKNDLIAKILASKAALDTHAALYPPDDLLAPPEEVDWNEDQIDTPPPQPEPKQQQKAAPEPEPAPQSPTTTTPAPAPAAAPDTTQPSAEDIELEKRRQRAARFGIPLVELQQKKPRAAAKPAAAPSADPKVLEKRAARFGLNTQLQAAPAASDAKANGNGKKRPAPQAQEVDPEELERRRKRAERFGTGNKA